jgi:hypothetical protein
MDVSMLMMVDNKAWFGDDNKRREERDWAWGRWNWNDNGGGENQAPSLDLPKQQASGWRKVAGLAAGGNVVNGLGLGWLWLAADGKLCY